MMSEVSLSRTSEAKPTIRKFRIVALESAYYLNPFMVTSKSIEVTK